MINFQSFNCKANGYKALFGKTISKYYQVHTILDSDEQSVILEVKDIRTNYDYLLRASCEKIVKLEKEVNILKR